MQGVSRDHRQPAWMGRHAASGAGAATQELPTHHHPPTHPVLGGLWEEGRDHASVELAVRAPAHPDLLAHHRGAIVLLRPAFQPAEQGAPEALACGESKAVKGEGSANHGAPSCWRGRKPELAGLAARPPASEIRGRAERGQSEGRASAGSGRGQAVPGPEQGDVTRRQPTRTFAPQVDTLLPLLRQLPARRPLKLAAGHDAAALPGVHRGQARPLTGEAADVDVCGNGGKKPVEAAAASGKGRRRQQQQQRKGREDEGDTFKGQQQAAGG